MLDKLNMGELRNIAQCMYPDSLESPGAEFLSLIQDSVRDALEFDRLKDEDVSDVAHEIADASVPVYTHSAWLAFIDLGAYNEEPEAGEWGSDLTEDVAKVALYQIGYRLAVALFECAEEEGDDGA